MTRVGAVDCGTNSIRLLVADIGAELTDVVRRLEIVRLGQGVDRTGRFDPQALRRTLAMVQEYAQTCRDLGAERVRFVATSATRDAADRDVFVEAVRREFGVAPEVISGTEEAALSFTGATRGLPGITTLRPVLIVDIGGGSTEAALGRDGQVLASRSVDVGCVRLTERHHGDPAAAMEDARAGVAALAAAVPFGQAGDLVGLAGTVTTVAAHALELQTYDSAAIHGARLSIDRWLDACADLIGRSTDHLGQLAYVHPGRRDVLRSGAIVWQAVLERARDAGLPDALVSEHDILDGIAWSLVGDQASE